MHNPNDLEKVVKMSIDAMTWLTFMCLALTIIFTLCRMRKLSLTFSVASLVLYIMANKTFLYLAFCSIKDMLQK